MIVTVITCVHAETVEVPADQDQDQEVDQEKETVVEIVVEIVVVIVIEIVILIVVEMVIEESVIFVSVRGMWKESVGLNIQRRRDVTDVRRMVTWHSDALSINRKKKNKTQVEAGEPTEQTWQKKRRIGRYIDMMKQMNKNIYM